MSDRNNEFDFDDDDFFGRDDEPPLPDEDEFPTDFDGDFDSDMPGFEPEPERQGGNRTFIILAAVMIILFLVGLAAVLFLALNQGPSGPQLTATAVVQLNQTTEALAAQTATQAVIFANATETQIALDTIATETAQALFDEQTATAAAASPVPTDTPTLDATSLAATQFVEATQTAIVSAAQAADATGTAIVAAQTAAAQTAAAAVTEEPTAEVIATEVAEVPTLAPGLSSIEQTGTALAVTFQALTQQALDAGGGEATPTPEGDFQPVVRPTALPDTGLFDDITGGGRDGLGLLALAVIGLVGVIFVSRRARSSNARTIDRTEDTAPKQ
ncbi:MAG: hypothetical protein IT320_14215 [Anaerolineae bacterium]|nr:hypothetical protein [Anaerolineae bacterium]